MWRWKKPQKPSESRSNAYQAPIEPIQSVTDEKPSSNVNRNAAAKSSTDQAKAKASKSNASLNKSAPVTMYASQYVDVSDLPAQPDPNVIKLMVVGDPGVGKTCFVLQWAEAGFNNTYIPTVGRISVGGWGFCKYLM